MSHSFHHQLRKRSISGPLHFVDGRFVFQQVNTPPAGQAQEPDGQAQAPDEGVDQQNTPPQTPETPPQAPGVQNTQNATRTAVGDLFSSEKIAERYSNENLLKELLSGIKTEEQRDMAILNICKAVKDDGGADVNPRNLVYAVANHLEENIGNDTGRRSDFLYAISSLVGKITPKQAEKNMPHPDVVRVFTKAIMVNRLQVENGVIQNYDIGEHVLNKHSGVFGSSELSKLKQEIRTEFVEGLAARYPSIVTEKWKKSLSNNFYGSAKKLLSIPDAKRFPQELIAALNVGPTKTFQEIAAQMEGRPGAEKQLRALKKSIEADIVSKVDHMLGDYVNYAAYNKDIRETFTAAEVYQNIDMNKGGVFSFADEKGGKAIGELFDIEETADDTTVLLRMGGSMQRISSGDFLRGWESNDTKVISKDPISRQEFASKYKLPQAFHEQTDTMLAISGDEYIRITGCSDRGCTFEGQNLSWTAFYAVADVKGWKFDFLMDDDLKPKKGGDQKKNKGQSFLGTFLSVFASPKHFIQMGEKLVEYFKEEWESADQERAYLLMKKMLPKDTVLRQEIESKLINLQDEQMSKRLDVLKKRTTTQVTEFAEVVFEKLLKGKYVKPAIIKATLLALLERGGELYYGNIARHRGSYYIYRALGGSIGDARYMEVLKNERSSLEDPQLQHPQEWRLLMNIFENDKDTWGETFDDKFDGTFNNSKQSQKDKHKGQLQDVNTKTSYSFLQRSEIWKQRFHRVEGGLESIVDREMGTGMLWESAFHLSVVGEHLEENQRKNIRNWGIAHHIPFLAAFRNARSTRVYQDALSAAIQDIARSTGTTSIEGCNLTTINIRDLAPPGCSDDKYKKARKITEGIYKAMGGKLLDYMSCKDGSFKMITDHRYAKYFTMMKEWVGETQKSGGSYDTDTYRYYNIFAENSGQRGGAGMFEQLLEPTSTSGAFRLDPRGETYVIEYLDQAEQLYKAINDSNYKDPHLGTTYTSLERAELRNYFQSQISQWDNFYFNRMPDSTFKSFVARKDISEGFRKLGFTRGGQLFPTSGRQNDNQEQGGL